MVINTMRYEVLREAGCGINSRLARKYRDSNPEFLHQYRGKTVVVLDSTGSPLTEDQIKPISDNNPYQERGCYER